MSKTFTFAAESTRSWLRRALTGGVLAFVGAIIAWVVVWNFVR